MLMRIFRFCKTLICPTSSMFHEAGPRIFLDPVALSLLLNRLELCESQISRLQNRVRVGSTVVLRNESNGKHLTLRIVKSEKACPAKGIVSFTSLIGAALLGLRCGDVAEVKSTQGELKWRLVSVNQDGSGVDS